MKKFLLAILGCLLLSVVVSSCETTTSIDSMYSCGVSNFKASKISDLGLIENHLKEKGCPFGSVIISKGKSVAANDAVMKERYNKAIATIDFGSLGLDSGTSFTYSVTGLHSGDESNREIGSYSWPK